MSKEVNLSNKNFTVKYGTVNKFQPEAVYLQFKGWGNKVRSSKNYESIISYLRRDLKLLVRDIQPDIFHPSFICNLDMKTSGIEKNNRAFIDLEFMFFQKNRENLIGFDNLFNIMNRLNKQVAQKLNENRTFKFRKRKS